MMIVGKDISIEELKELMHICTPELAREIDEAEAKMTPEEKLVDRLQVLASKIDDISSMIEEIRDEADELDIEVKKITGDYMGTNRLDEAENLLDTMISVIQMESEGILNDK